MTATDPRPQLAAMPAARLAPAAALALLDRSANRMPGPETAATPADAPDEPAAERPDAGAGRDGRLIECHVGGRMFVGLPDTPGFEGWRERQRRREEGEKQEAAARDHDKT